MSPYPAFDIDLSVVLPAHNEEHAIESVAESVIRFCEHYVASYEVIVVNDGSTDRTTSILEKLKNQYSKVRVVSHADQRGYGEALRTGFQAAGKEWIFLMDADEQFSIDDLRTFLPQTRAYSVIVGYRARRADAFVRICLTGLYMVLVRGLLATPVRDAGCGFKLFRRTIWQRVQPIEALDDKLFSVEFLQKAGNVTPILELPVHHFPRRAGMASGASLSVMMASGKELIRTYRRRNL